MAELRLSGLLQQLPWTGCVGTAEIDFSLSGSVKQSPLSSRLLLITSHTFPYGRQLLQTSYRDTDLIHEGVPAVVWSPLEGPTQNAMILGVNIFTGFEVVINSSLQALGFSAFLQKGCDAL